VPELPHQVVVVPEGGPIGRRPARAGGVRRPGRLATVRALVVAIVAGGAASAEQASPAHPPTIAGRPGAQVVARVNGVPIAGDRLTLAVNALLPLESFHRNVSADKLTALRQKALDGLIDEELRYQDGVRRGITVTSPDIDAQWADLTQRYGGASRLEEAERRAGVTGPELRQDVRRALTVKAAYEKTVTANCQVGPVEAEAYFRDHPDRFVLPEQLHIYAITIGVDPSSPPAAWAAARRRAEDVLRRLRQGAAFEAMARAYSTDPSRTSGGDMGYFHRGTLNDDFEAAAGHLAVGQASGIVHTIYGYHIIRIGDIRPSRQKTFDEVSAQLQQDLTARRCTDVDAAWTTRLRANARVDIEGAPDTGPSAPHIPKP